MRPDVKEKIYPDFAPLAVRGAHRAEQLYERWVSKLALKEYVDELIVLAAALELSIRIVVVPYAPESAPPFHGRSPLTGQQARRRMRLGQPIWETTTSTMCT